MNASERLQAIIKQRLEGESFGWGVILSVWATVFSVRLATEIFTGPTLVGGTLAVVLVLGFQVFWSLRPQASAATRSWTLQGLWILLAAALWFLGTMAPVFGFLTPHAAAVLELLFLAGGLTQTGLMKARKGFWIGGMVLAVGSVTIAVFPALLALRCVLVAVTLGWPAVLTAVSDKNRD